MNRSPAVAADLQPHGHRIIIAEQVHDGSDLIIFGGADKRALARGQSGIDEEVEQKVKPMLQHYASADISFENYMYYKIKVKGLRTAGI